MDVIDTYLQHLQEGLWSRFREIVEFPASKHPRWKGMVREYYRHVERCRRLHPGESTKVKVGYTGKETDAGFEYTQYKSNPKLQICLMKVRILYLQSFLQWIKETQEDEICKYNRNKSKCKAWVSKTKESADQELKELMKFLKDVQRGNLSQAAFKKIVGRIT